MARYTTPEVFTFNVARYSRLIVVDSSVTLEVWNGESFITDQRSPLLTGTHEIITRGIKIRISPVLGGYLIEEGEYA